MPRWPPSGARIHIDTGAEHAGTYIHAHACDKGEGDCSRDEHEHEQADCIALAVRFVVIVGHRVFGPGGAWHVCGVSASDVESILL